MKAKVSYKTQLYQFNVGLKLHYIHVPEDVAFSMTNKFPFRVFCKMNDYEFPAAIVKHGEDGLIIQMGKQTIKKANVDLHDEIEVQLKRDDTEHGFDIPAEFEELLLQDEDGRLAWEKLTPGNQRSFLHYLNSSKTMDTTIKRSITVLKRAQEKAAKKRLS